MLALSFLLLWIKINALSETHFKWSDGIRPYLKCPIDCLDLTDSVNFHDTDSCCRCNAQAQWDLDDSEVEYISIENGTLEKQKSVLANTFNDKDSDGKEISVLNKTFKYNLVNKVNKIIRFQILMHTYSLLRETPKNLCSFSKLVKIDLTGNYIEEVPYIGNLSVLDTLILRYNRIKIVDKRTFYELSYLRIIDLAHNAIKSIDPETLSSLGLSLHKVSLDHNNLQLLDVSNFLLEKRFCALYYGENKIMRLTNQLHFSLSKLNLPSGGFVDLQNNLFQSFFNFTELGLRDIRYLGYLFHFWFDFRGPKWNCDCSFVPFLEMLNAGKWLIKVRQESFNVICNYPPNLRGLTIPDLVNRNRLDDFVCRIFESCPSACYCYYQPSRSRNVVNCSNLQINKLPREVPDFDNIHLLLCNDIITEFDNVNYINRLAFADLSRNPITNLSNDLIQAIRNRGVSVNLTNISLQDIPITFRDMDPCELKLGYQRIHCNCKNKWVQPWLLSKQAGKCNATKLYCLGEDKLVIDFDMNSIYCREDSTELNVKISLVIAVITVTIACCCALLFYCRYEMLLIQSKLVIRNKRYKFKYDAYISFYEYSAVISTWVHHVLVPFLEDNGYSLYVPSRDDDVGDVKEQSIITGISDSRNIIVVLSECHKRMDDNEQNTIWINTEWRHAWNQLISKGNSRDIVMINFDCLRWRDFSISPMRAFLRLGMSLDFSNKRNSLLSEVQCRLGNPDTSTLTHFA